METIKPDKRIERLGSEEDYKRHKVLGTKSDLFVGREGQAIFGVFTWKQGQVLMVP